MKKTNKNNNHKFLSKNYIKGAISGALALTILCSGVGVAAYSAGADNTAQALGVQTESTVEAVKKASTTKEALKKLSKNETVYVIADANGAAKKIIVSDWLKGVDTKGKIKDVSNLKDVKNVKGDETYTVNEDNAYEWAAKCWRTAAARTGADAPDHRSVRDVGVLCHDADHLAAPHEPELHAAQHRAGPLA